MCLCRASEESVEMFVVCADLLKRVLRCLCLCRSSEERLRCCLCRSSEESVERCLCRSSEEC